MLYKKIDKIFEPISVQKDLCRIYPSLPGKFFRTWKRFSWIYTSLFLVTFFSSAGVFYPRGRTSAPSRGLGLKLGDQGQQLVMLRDTRVFRLNIWNSRVLPNKNTIFRGPKLQKRHLESSGGPKGGGGSRPEYVVEKRLGWLPLKVSTLNM